MTPDELLAHWLDAGPERWFSSDPDFDASLRARFLSTHEAAARGELRAWEASAEGACALVILLDQLPRNMFRGTPRAFASDALAREVASRAIERGFDCAVDPRLRTFFYLPFMHSEAQSDQERCVALYRAAGDSEGARYAELHRDVIARFGRFPHRNPVLGRATSAEERAFLERGGFAG